MKLFKNIFIVSLILFTNGSFSQEKIIKSVEKDYDNFAYIKTTEVLLKVAEKGYRSVELFKKLANSYYFNNNLKEAAKWYGYLMRMKDPTLDPEYYFRYAQSLKGIEEYEEANIWMAKFFKEKPEDSRGRAFVNNVEYLSDIIKDDQDIDLINININSEYSDFGGAQYKNQLVFASTRGKGKRYNWNEQPFLDLYYANKIDLGEYLEEKKYSKEVNSKFHESSAAFTADAKYMFFTRNNYYKKTYKEDSEGVNRLKIFKASMLPNGEWGGITSVHFNSDEYSVAHPSINKAGTVMYFASDMPGTIGLSDIFRVEINSDGRLGVPENLGNVINTEGEESFPFINAKGDLFFASNGHLGLGGLDIFVARNFEDKYKNGDKIFIDNLGKPMNSSFEDFAYAEDQESVEGYLSSNRDGGKGDDDIYAFLIPECKPILDGIVKESGKNIAIVDSNIKLFDNKGNEILTMKLEDVYRFVLELECNKEYLIRADKKGYVGVEKRFTTPSSTNSLLIELFLDKDEHLISEGDDLAQILDIPIIYFDFDKYNIRYDAQVELQKLLNVLKEYPNMEIEIRSHTDCRGTVKYNKSLSNRRAQSTKQYLIENGIASNRLKAIGYGESQPVNKCNCGGDINIKTSIKDLALVKLIEEDNINFNKVIEADSIKFYGTREIAGTKSGYYIIGNVYSRNFYFKKFMKSLKEKGYSPEYFTNRNNNWKYVYLEYFDTWQEAVASYKSKIDGNYQDEMWILKVDNGDLRYDHLQANGLSNKDDNSDASNAKEKITYHNFQDTQGVKSGYYLIANVFKSKTNAIKFIEILKQQGLAADSFFNPTNNFTYVYIKRFDSFKSAKIASQSKLEGTYNKEIWILKINGIGDIECSEAEHQLNRRSEFIVTKM
ncbi:OmpA family protein [Aestuariivivens sp. NBU2969]|uniref:OmpA family protein n=1 Tax=Aestuariivivens sp. NBU2969 TaxID=2873267 RepID=UPI001CBDE29F|nr:OmpA family protein [Aestuariivivens sp. NBU2969]